MLGIWRSLEHLSLLSVRFCDTLACTSQVFLAVKLISVIINIYLAYEYFVHDEINFFWVTTLCIIIPGFVTVALNLYMYQEDVKENTVKRKPWYNVLLGVILLPFFFRYWQSLILCIQCKRAELRKDREAQKHYHNLLIKEDSDVALIRIFECFLEATPQKVLQITIYLMSAEELRVSQGLSILSSFTSITWCMASYYRCIRSAQTDKKPISFQGSIMQCCWHFCITVSRITSICLIASIFLTYTFIASILHSFLMTIWIYVWDRSPFCADKCGNGLLFSVALGFVYIFAYILPREGDTRYRYLVYYIICGLENLSAVVLYCLFIPDTVHHMNTSIFLCVLSIVPFILGIIFMVVYYQYFHPNITARRDLINRY